jgi:hypothetical protein
VCGMAEPITLQTMLTYLTLISVPVGVFYHIMTLRNTRKNQELTLRAQEQALVTRQAQLFMQIYDKSISKEYADAMKVLRGVKFDDYEEYKHYMVNMGDYPDKVDAWNFIGGFYEGLGLLVMEDLISIRMVTVFMGNSITRFYNKFGGPYIHQFRDETGITGILSETEYLYNRVKKFIEENPDYKDY